MENTTKMFQKYLIERQITSGGAEIRELNIKTKGVKWNPYTKRYLKPK